MISLIVAWVCLFWYLFIALVSSLGYVQLRRYYSAPPTAPSRSTGDSDDVPHVTIIRPVKGLEPSLYECLAATFRQTYPGEKLTIFFCVASRDDPAVPILERLVAEFAAFGARLLVEEEDPRVDRLGPNPKIRNMSRAYREAKGDIVWVLDCNVWIGKGVARRMVARLSEGKRKNKFVHQLPLVVDVDERTSLDEVRDMLSANESEEVRVSSTSTSAYDVQKGLRSEAPRKRLLQYGGGRLEELFMSSSHAKFYTAINTVLVAPCIIGKSSMFRRSHLDFLTDGHGIDFFSHNICEDHLIGDLLWKRPVPDEASGAPMGKHALLFGDPAIQPIAGMSVAEYVARRVRWLRVRKFTVLVATLVEPGTESFLCSLYGAYGATTIPWFRRVVGLPQTWTVFALLWLLSVTTWAAVDWTLYRVLHSAACIELDEYTPSFARPRGRSAGSRRTFQQWLAAWLGREALAFPVWAWAVYGGASVVWRGKRFWVGVDMRVHEMQSKSSRVPDGQDHKKKI